MITAEQVRELRELTGAGMMECKRVLEETNGDKEKASELLRERGVVKAAKKAGRIASEGLVEAYIHNGKYGAMVEVNSETDFVSKNEEFKEIHRYYTTREKNPLKKMQSLIAVACKLIRVFHVILTKGIRYDASKMLGDIKRPGTQRKAA